MLARSLPDVPGSLRKFGEEQVLKRKLMHLLDRVDGALAEMPVEVEERPNGHFAWAFGAVGFRVRRDTRSVVAYGRLGNIRFPRPVADVEVFKPLSNREWLVLVLAQSGLSVARLQRHLFVDDAERKRQEAWLTEAAWQRIRGDERFRRLRRQLLPSALGLDKELMSLALRARPFPNHQGVSNKLYTRVWQNEEVFRRVGRENPQLLPLVSIAIRFKALQSAEDPVAGVRRVFLEGGVSPAGWRYLARHGARIFSLVWKGMLCGSPLRAAIQHLKRLDAAGLPPPPTPALFNITEFVDAPADILGLTFRAGREAVAQGRHLAFLDEAAVVMSWADAAQPVLDKRQRRAGWPWVVRQAAEWKRRRDLLRTAGPQAWTSVVGGFGSPPYAIVPLDSVALMVEEAQAMRNCLVDCIRDCQRGASRFFSVREQATGERVAVFEIRVSKDGSRWTLGDVRGPRNAAAGVLVQQKAAALAQLYDTLDPAPRPLPLPVDPVERLLDGGRESRSQYLFTVPGPRLTP